MFFVALEQRINYFLFFLGQHTYLLFLEELSLFVTVPDSRLNPWVSWFIFNLQKINTNQYYESDTLNAGIVARYLNT
jgi:hypothetical protein